MRKEILPGELEPARAMSHDDLATRYNVSRISVREALRSLAAEHLVEHIERGAPLARRPLP